jgi:hypothetical protein
VVNLKIQDIKNATIEEITTEFDTQIIYMCMGVEDKALVNELGKELRSRGELGLLRKYQGEVIQAFRR